MTLYRRSTFARLGLVVAALLFAGIACSLSGGDDKKDSNSAPTVEATITQPATRTAFPTFTAFPTLTPIQQQFQPPPTATKLSLLPTSAYTYATWTPIPATTYPYDVRISYPVDGSQVAGYITIVGSASHPRFLQYALEWGPNPNPTNLWYPLTSPQTRPVINGALGAWNTTLTPDGVYQIRLHVWLNDGTETYALVTGIRISNSAPTAVPTLTPTPRPNRLPSISPILSQEINSGQTVKIGVTTSDPDGDTVNLFVASSNKSVAAAQVTAKSEVSVTGVTAGSATITVTANDNRGGLASTAFIVTVTGKNRAPTIIPILAQTVEVGQSLTVAIQASDPDNDSLTLSAVSSDTGVVTTNVVNAQSISLTGVAPGKANVTVTASDGKGGEINTAFQVTVGSQNQPPVIETIFPQTLSVGETLSVAFSVADPDGDTLQATATSDTPDVVTASVTSPGVVTLTALKAGPATVTLSVTDGNHDPTVASFSVTVLEGNQPPTVDTIPPQTMSVGQTLGVNYNALDPDGDQLQATVSSDNDAVVSASVAAAGSITLTANSAGTATITLKVTDNVNSPTEVTFTVSVTAANQPPVFDGVPGPQTLTVGQSVDVGYSVMDPDGDTVQVTASSDNPGVASAAVNTPGLVSLAAAANGTVNVTLTATDTINAPVTVSFTVTVSTANQPPVFDGVPGPQTLTVGQSVDVGYSVTDPDGDTVQVTASSDNPGVVNAVVNTPGLVSLAAAGNGTANVTLTATDTINAPVPVSFTVTVTAANQPPVFDGVPGPQTLAVGQSVDVGYSVTDPDGDAVQVTASSDNPGVVNAVVNTPGLVSLAAAGNGTANVTLTATDTINAPVTVSFTVSVSTANQPPVFDGVPGPQTLAVGQSVDVGYSVTDPDGDAVQVTASSDNPGVVSAAVNTPGLVSLAAAANGTVNVTLTATDTINAPVTASFTVTVAAANQPPVIQQVPDQAINVGEEISIPVSITDPDSPTVVLTAISNNQGVVTAQAVNNNSVGLLGVSEGTTTVDLTADDAQGGVTTSSFTVTVSSAGPTFNLMDYPVLPDISGPMAQSLTQLYQSGIANFANQPGAFSKVGDDPMDSQNFLVPFGTGSYDLSGRDALQSVIDMVTNNPSGNSFTVDSMAAGNGYGIDSLSAPAPGGSPCDAVGGGTNLSCEVQLTHPTIALISFSAPNVTYMPADQFRSELQSLVSTLMSNYGVIPVLATIPQSNGITTDQLAEYNRAIVEIATQTNVTGIPLWNLWRAMEERGIGDPNSVAPEGPGNLSDAALNYGFNMRNLTALQVLNQVWTAVGAK